jgi:PleD family two-component response regulator
MNARARATDSPPQTENRVIILLVDDEMIEAELFSALLGGEEDVEFHYCPRPDEAIEQADRFHPSVIMQDLSMPGDHGFSLITRYRAHPTTKDTPVLVFSGEESPGTKSIAFNLGANDYIVKTVDRVELLARVRYHSNAYWAQRQRDEALRALRESQQQLWDSNASLLEANRKLIDALKQVKQLTGLLPMCACCRRVRDEKNYWREFGAYVSSHTDLRLSHGVCEDCLEKYATELGLSPEEIQAVAKQVGKKRSGKR